MTHILEIESGYGLQYVNDQRLNKMAKENPALYARNAWGYMQFAIPSFKRPAHMLPWLLGDKDHPKLIKPRFDSYYFDNQTYLVDDLTLHLGENYIGYELFNCKIVTEDRDGNLFEEDADNKVEYDAETGDVTIHGTQAEPIKPKTTLSMDFYTDGYFVEDLNEEQKRILGLAFGIAWQERFNNDYLSNVAKVEDRSFSQQNIANKQKSDDLKLRNMRASFNQEMRKYEQNLQIRKYTDDESL